MNEASRYLRTLAEQVATACILHTQPQAILLTGSVASGESDPHSDIDLITYFDELPSPTQLQALHEQLGCESVLERGRDEGAFVEEYDLQGVECQVLYTTIQVWEQELTSVLEHFTAKTPVQKAIDGLLHGQPLHGADRIAQWQARARAYPEGLARAMVQAHLQFFPLWRVQDWVAARDMSLFVYETLVESGYNLLGILAGLNRVYFAPFRLKRQRAFIERLRIAPSDLADRLEGLFSADYGAAVAEVERLVSETVALVEAHMPELDTSPVRQDLGTRRTPWALPPGKDG